MQFLDGKNGMLVFFKVLINSNILYINYVFFFLIYIFHTLLLENSIGVIIIWILKLNILINYIDVFFFKQLPEKYNCKY